MIANERIRATEVPPHDEDAERGFVGGLLRHSDYFEELPAAVPTEAIFHPQLRLIYRAMLQLRDANHPVDAITVHGKLEANGWTEDAGGEFAVARLVTEVLTGAQVPFYASILLDHLRRRQLLSYAGEAMRDAYRLDDPSEITARLESRLAEIESARADATLFRMGDVAAEVVTEVRERKESGRQGIGVPTGFMDFDAMTGGLVKTELVVIGARPSQGKTAFAVNVLRNAARHSNVLFVSVEMSRHQIGQRMLASESGVDSLAIRQAALSQADLGRITHSAAEIGKSDFWIADLPGATIADVLHAVRQHRRKHPALAVVAVDYLQLIENDDKRVSRQEQVASISRRLKALARSLGVCVMALSQLNRNPEGRKDKRPEMGDLRESGAVEQDADVIALLHRPEQNDPRDRPGEADLIVCKVRQGPIGEILLHFDKRTTTFRNGAHEMNEAPFSANPVAGANDDYF